MTPNEVLEKLKDTQIFYEFHLPDGSGVPIAKELKEIHDTRRKMIFDYLDIIYKDRWNTVDALDIACHQGWFSHLLHEKGCNYVLGIDIRKSHIEEARLISTALQDKNVYFRQENFFSLPFNSNFRNAKLTLMLGFLYHLEDPVMALRILADKTREVAIIETQVSPNFNGEMDWGAETNKKPIMGTFSLIDEEKEIEDGNKETNISRISLVPSLDAIQYILKNVGFPRVEIIKPFEGACSQFADGKRVILAAFKS